MAEKQTKGNPLKKVRKHGYRARKSTASGRAVIKRRRDKGRARVA